MIQAGQTVKAPDFFPLAKQVVLRVWTVGQDVGKGAPKLYSHRRSLPGGGCCRTRAADDTRFWWDVAGYSGRLGREQQLGGLVGTAMYYAAAWKALLPWLVWGEVVQVGKNVVKGCGLYRLRVV